MKKSAPAWERTARSLQEDQQARLRWKVLRLLGIAPYSRQDKDMTQEEILLCAVHLYLDGQEHWEHLCPRCREQLRTCPSCHTPLAEENPAFDHERFEELKNFGKLG